ncbi:hypothetical protein [Cytobacillus sp. FSL R7-0680]|uniref:hypothetical protein n=1 Tax=Cytobacillus sp. FSL R7-0680 TaxID=2921689 RepID=UPI0030F50237
MEKINVIDSVMGSGKTSWAIQYMNEADKLERFIYITPFLSEVKRIKEGVVARDFIEPNNANHEGRKLRSLKDLIVQGRDIVSTHSLFQAADDELIELLTDSGYTLILDEVMDVIEPVNVKASDIKKLESSRDIKIENNKVIWTGDPNDDSRYSDIRLLAQAGNLFYYRGKFLVWAFPPAVFRALSAVYVMTYLFDGSLQRNYYDMFEFEYDYHAVKLNGDKYELIDYDIKAEKRDELFALIDLYDGKLNDVGNRKNALSASYLRNADVDMLKPLRNNTYNFFYNIAKVKKSEAYYSTLKEVETPLAPRSYKGSAIPINARATNDYSEARAIAYLFNRYPNPHVKAFFQDNNVTVNEDLLAVGDLLQWIWRSRIRNGEPIQAYIPSSRMRKLLEAWAKYEI